MPWQQSVYLNGRLVEVLNWDTLESFLQAARSGGGKNSQLHRNWRIRGGKASTHYVDGAGNQWRLTFHEVSRPTVRSNPSPRDLKEDLEVFFLYNEEADERALARRAGVSVAGVQRAKEGLPVSRGIERKIGAALDKYRCGWCRSLMGGEQLYPAAWSSCKSCGGI